MSTTLSDICKQLRLAYVSETLEKKFDTKASEIVSEVLNAELEGRRRAKLGKLVHVAGFPHIKTLEGYCFENITFPPGCSKEKLLSLEWLEHNENVLMLGSVGTGKTHMAISLGVEACRQGRSVQFFRAADLVYVRQIC